MLRRLTVDSMLRTMLLCALAALLLAGGAHAQTPSPCIPSNGQATNLGVLLGGPACTVGPSSAPITYTWTGYTCESSPSSLCPSASGSSTMGPMILRSSLTLPCRLLLRAAEVPHISTLWGHTWSRGLSARALPPIGSVQVPRNELEEGAHEIETDHENGDQGCRHIHDSFWVVGAGGSSNRFGHNL